MQPNKTHPLFDFNSNEMKQEKKEFITNLQVSNADILRIMNYEQRTDEWLESRKGRITASNYGSATYHNKYCSPHGLIKQMLWKTFKGNFATEYGTKNEPVASDVYEKFMRKHLDEGGKKHVNFKVDYPGLIVNFKNPWIACSPDGLPLEGLIRFLLEIKCPIGKKFYPHIPHYYFDQIQGIMGLLNLPYCDFVVWTPDKTQIRRYKFDNLYWETCLFPKLKSFYMDEYLPRHILKMKNLLPENCIDVPIEESVINIQDDSSQEVSNDINFIINSVMRISKQNQKSREDPSTWEKRKKQKIN